MRLSYTRFFEPTCPFLCYSKFLLIFFSFSFIQNQNHLDLLSIPFETKNPLDQMPSQPQLILSTHSDSNHLTPVSISQQIGLGCSLSRPHSPPLMQTSPNLLFDKPATAFSRYYHFCFDLWLYGRVFHDDECV